MSLKPTSWKLLAIVFLSCVLGSLVIAQSPGQTTSSQVISEAIKPTPAPSPTPLAYMAAIGDPQRAEDESLERQYRLREFPINSRILQVASFLPTSLGLVALTLYFFLLLRSKRDARYFKPIEDGAHVLNEIRFQAISDARMYSIASLGAAFVGIGIIFAGILLAYQGSVPAALLSAISGIITGGVAALFFREAQKRRKRVDDIEDKIHQELKQHSLLKSIENKSIADSVAVTLLTGGQNLAEPVPNVRSLPTDVKKPVEQA